MASGMTTRGQRVATDWFDGASTPASLALVLTTDVPTEATKVLSELTEVTAGNGYSAGGQAVALNGTDWDTETESDTPGQVYFERRLKDFTWTASGGNIPASGNGPKAVVLVDDAGDPNVIAWLDLVTERTILSGQTLTVQDFRVLWGYNVVTTPTQFEQGSASVTPGNGSKGSYTELIASTAFDATEIVITAERGTLGDYLLDIATGAAASETNIFDDLVLEDASANDQVVFRFRRAIPQGTRISARAQATGGTTAFTVQVGIGG